MRQIAEGAWLLDSGAPGPALALSFGVHGDERPPIDAGLRLVASFESGELAPARGKLLLLHANPRATAEDRRWSGGGVDLNRCFAAAALERPARLYEEGRAQEIARLLGEVAPDVLVDFHCTVEPGEPFLMQHPAAAHAPSRAVARLLSAPVLLADPDLNFGGVSLDEWMSTRGRVGICYETGWLRSPACTPEFVLGEMTNVLAGHGMLAGREPALHDDKTVLQLERVIRCEAAGFTWAEGVGHNLQALPAGTVLGSYRGGDEVTLPVDATLVFPKKKPELVEIGKPLVYLGVARG